MRIHLFCSIQVSLTSRISTKSFFFSAVISFFSFSDTEAKGHLVSYGLLHHGYLNHDPFLFLSLLFFSRREKPRLSGDFNSTHYEIAIFSAIPRFSCGWFVCFSSVCLVCALVNVCVCVSTPQCVFVVLRFYRYVHISSRNVSHVEWKKSWQWCLHSVKSASQNISQLTSWKMIRGERLCAAQSAKRWRKWQATHRRVHSINERFSLHVTRQTANVRCRRHTRHTKHKRCI